MAYTDESDVYYIIYADIDTDDDFELDIGCDIKLKGFNTEEEARQGLKKTLLEAKVVWSKEWNIHRVGDGGELVLESQGDSSSAWFSLRDRMIEQLDEGNSWFTLGGNQAAEVWVSKRDRKTEREYKEALLRVSPEDRKILGLQDPDKLGE